MDQLECQRGKFSFAERSARLGSLCRINSRKSLGEGKKKERRVGNANRIEERFRVVRDTTKSHTSQ